MPKIQPTNTRTYAAPSGSHPVGIRDGELLDTQHPTMRPEDDKGRRLMVRVWYPAANADGEHRPYLVGDEDRIVAWSVEANGVPASWLDSLAAVTTYGVEDAPVLAGPHPTLVFSHGASSWVSQNTPLMEHLASHGYVVWAVAHPGEASGVRFPGGDLVRYDDHFHHTFVELGSDPRFLTKITGEIDERFAVTPGFLDDQTMGPWARRWVDDMLAVIDAIATDAIHGAASSLVGPSDLTRLGVAGMSFGAAAAAALAHQDDRVAAAVSLDGGQFLSDLLDTEMRVPVLLVGTDTRAQLEAMGVAGVQLVDANEFFFEPLVAAGASKHVHRLLLEGVAHVELCDFVLLPLAERGPVIPGGGTVETQRVIDIVNDLVLAHLDAVLRGTDTGFPGRQLAAYPELSTIDMSPVREWATATQ